MINPIIMVMAIKFILNLLIFSEIPLSNSLDSIANRFSNDLNSLSRPIFSPKRNNKDRLVNVLQLF